MMSCPAIARDRLGVWPDAVLVALAPLFKGLAILQAKLVLRLGTALPVCAAVNSSAADGTQQQQQQQQGGTIPGI